MKKSILLSIENEWKEMTTLGNTYFETQKQKALLEYVSAFSKAEKLITYSEICSNCNIPALHIYLISCNNIAETYSQLERWEQANKMYKRAIFYLLHLNHISVEKVDTGHISKSLFKQVLLYKEFTTKYRQPDMFKTILEAVHKEGFKFKSA